MGKTRGNLSKPSEEGNASLIPSEGERGSRLGESILGGYNSLRKILEPNLANKGMDLP